MDNKKYIDKVINHLVRGTKIDYKNNFIYFPFSSPSSRIQSLTFFSLSRRRKPLFSFSKYCRNQFGLTEEEVEYVWKEYREIIKNKIENGK